MQWCWSLTCILFFFFNDTATTEIYTLSLHDALPISAALAVLQALGADVQAGARALSQFHGVGRRFERLGAAGGVTGVDDYAHHPTEVAATLAAARQAFPGRRGGAVVAPHLFSRTALDGEAFGEGV